MIQKLATNKLFVALTAIFCCALWGVSTPVVKMGYAYLDASHVPSLLLWVGMEFLAAGLLTVGAYSLVSKRLVLPKRESAKGVALLSVLQTVLQYSFLYVGLLYTTSVKGAILKSTDVFFVALLASLVFKMEKLTLVKGLSCIIGFSGIVIMNLNGLSLNFSLMGDGMVLLGIFSYSFAVIATKRIAQREDPFVLCGYQMALGGFIMLVIGLLLNGRVDLAGLLPVFVCLAVIYALSYSLWTVLLKYNSASGVTIFSFMTPVFGVVFSALMLNEDSGVAALNLVLALVLVCLGIVLWGREKPASEPKRND